jgi:hypothetical protein
MSHPQPPPAADGRSDPEDRHRLTTLSGLAALSLDALSSVAYGPEAIVINGIGAVLTLAALAVELISKFTEGAWLIVLIIPLLAMLFTRVHLAYDRIGSLLQIGQVPSPPVEQSSLVVVPIGGMSRLTPGRHLSGAVARR